MGVVSSIPVATGDGSHVGTFLGGEDERIWDVFTNSASDDKWTLIATGAYPVYGSFHPDNPISTCRDVIYSQRSKFYWRVTASYSTRPETQSEKEEREQEDPLNRLPATRWSFNSYTKAIYEDINGEAIVNSAGDYFDPPVEIEEFRPVATVQTNVVAGTLPFNIMDFMGRINSSVFTFAGQSVPAESARIVVLDLGEDKRASNVSYNVFTYAIEFNPDTYVLRVLDQGFRRQGAIFVEDILIEDADGNRARPSSQVLLDGAGDILENPSPATAEFRPFDVYESIDFHGLPGVS